MKRNPYIAVFKKIDMHDGDKEVCWEYRGSVDKDRPYFYHNNKKTLAYRIVFNLMNEPELRDFEVVRHKCDNPICCNPFHLERGSHQENMDDMKERERHGLPHTTVRAIKRLLEKGDTHQSIADKFGTTRENITAINRGVSYKHIEIGEEDD